MERDVFRRASQRVTAARSALAVDQSRSPQTLKDLLEPMGLGYRCVDAGLFQITSAERLKHTSEFEIYPISDLLDRRGTAEEIIATLRKAMRAEWFSDRGGPGPLTFDERSGALLANFPQEGQIVLERLLAELRAEAPK